mmetsp:Transcript_60413/g.98769  ORF Transcript_60413/g.98769 Transcript_60413/m.98769 type:complete len:296 (-) Transcript_60413:179-1066(-)
MQLQLIAITWSILWPLLAAKQCHDEVELFQKGLAPTIELTAQDAIPEHMAQIMHEAKDVIRKATREMTHAFDTMDYRLATLEKDFQTDVENFKAAGSQNSTVNENMTAFKALMEATVTRLLPFYKQTSEEVASSFEAVTSSLSMMGQKDSRDKLDGVESIVIENMNEMSRVSGDMNTDLKEATEEKLGDYIVTMDRKLENLVSTSEELMTKIDDRLAAFGGSVQEPLTLAVGESAINDIQKLSQKSHQSLQHLQTMLSRTSGNLSQLATGLDAAEAARETGFFGRIFQGLANLFG